MNFSVKDLVGRCQQYGQERGGTLKKKNTGSTDVIKQRRKEMYYEKDKRNSSTKQGSKGIERQTLMSTITFISYVYQRNTVDESKSHLKLFHKSTRSKW